MGYVGIRDLLLLVPFLLSDGGVSPKGANGWLIYFRNNDKILINYFIKFLNKVTQNKIQVQTKKDGSYFVRVNDKELGKKLLKLSLSFRTQPCNMHPVCPGYRKYGLCKSTTIDGRYHKIILPEEFVKYEKIQKLFLRIYFTCDGGISVISSNTRYPFLVRKVFVNIKHPTLRKDFYKLLVVAGFNPKVYSEQIRLTTQEDLIKFYRTIGFVEGVKISNHSKKFVGFEKNNLLRLLVNSYINPRKLIMLTSVRNKKALS